MAGGPVAPLSRISLPFLSRFRALFYDSTGELYFRM
jgi:hypothetical protein